MKRSEPRLFWGIFLIIGGLLFLMESIGILAFDNLWPIIFGIAGIAFLFVFVTTRENWWAVIPGMTLLGLASMIGLEQLYPEANEAWAATLFLGSLSLAFLAVYARTAAQQWWAIIPAGVLGSIALLIGFENLLSESLFAGLFMFSLSATFVLVYILPNPAGKMKWALYPAGILGAIGLLILVAATRLIGILGPAAIIALGLYLIFKRSTTWE